MEAKLNIDQDLFEEFSKFFRNSFKLPPLPAKIASYLMFDFKAEGLTFQELTVFFNSSKSSVSAALNLLLEIGLIKDFTKPEERRRYFVNNPHYAKIRFQDILSKLTTEVDLIDRLYRFRADVDPIEYEKFQIYRTLLTNNITNIEDSLIKLYDEK